MSASVCQGKRRCTWPNSVYGTDFFCLGSVSAPIGRRSGRYWWSIWRLLVLILENNCSSQSPKISSIIIVPHWLHMDTRSQTTMDRLTYTTSSANSAKTYKQLQFGHQQNRTTLKTPFKCDNFLALQHRRSQGCSGCTCMPQGCKKIFQA